MDLSLWANTHIAVAREKEREKRGVVAR